MLPPVSPHWRVVLSGSRAPLTPQSHHTWSPQTDTPGHLRQWRRQSNHAVMLHTLHCSVSPGELTSSVEGPAVVVSTKLHLHQTALKKQDTLWGGQKQDTLWGGRLQPCHRHCWDGKPGSNITAIATAIAGSVLSPRWLVNGPRLLRAVCDVLQCNIKVRCCSNMSFEDLASLGCQDI